MLGGISVHLQELWAAENISICLFVQLSEADMDTTDAKWKLAALLPQFASVLVSVISEHRANRYSFLTEQAFLLGAIYMASDTAKIAVSRDWRPHACPE